MDKVNKKFRTAIIGAGFGRYGLMPAFLLNKNLDVFAVCTRREETAQKFAKEYNIVNTYHSWQKLLEEEKIDVLGIAAPPAVQAEITQVALQKKIPVFLEKQIAANLSQSKQLYELATTQSVPNCVNFIFPYLHTWQQAYTYLKKGTLGTLRHIFLNWRMESYDNLHHTPDIWKTNNQQGGGILQHFLSHSLHYLEYFFGKIMELRCTLDTAPDLQTTGSTFASLDLISNNGPMIHIAASSGAYVGTGHSLEIYGSEGSLLLQNTSKDPVAGFKLFYAARGNPFEEIAHELNTNPNSYDSRVFPTSTLVNQFVSSLCGNTHEYPTIIDGHRVQVLLDYANHANLNRRFVKVQREPLIKY